MLTRGPSDKSGQKNLGRHQPQMRPDALAHISLARPTCPTTWALRYKHLKTAHLQEGRSLQGVAGPAGQWPQLPPQLLTHWDQPGLDHEACDIVHGQARLPTALLAHCITMDSQVNTDQKGVGGGRSPCTASPTLAVSAAQCNCEAP